MKIFGIPITIDFTPPPTQEELDMAGEHFTQLLANGYGGSPEGEEFEAAMDEAGYMPSWITEEQRFVWVPLNIYPGGEE